MTIGFQDGRTLTAQLFIDSVYSILRANLSCRSEVSRPFDHFFRPQKGMIDSRMLSFFALFLLDVSFEKMLRSPSKLAAPNFHFASQFS